jgi:hypothetical protein
LREDSRRKGFENRVLGRIFAPKRDSIIGGWRKLHIEELHNLYSSPSIIRMIKSRRMRWAGHVGRMGEKMNANRILVGKPEGRVHKDDLDVGERIMLKWIIDKWNGMVLDWIHLAQVRNQWRALVYMVMKFRVP